MASAGAVRARRGGARCTRGRRNVRRRGGTFRCLLPACCARGRRVLCSHASLRRLACVSQWKRRTPAAHTAQCSACALVRELRKKNKVLKKGKHGARRAAACGTFAVPLRNQYHFTAAVFKLAMRTFTVPLRNPQRRGCYLEVLVFIRTMCRNSYSYEYPRYPAATCIIGAKSLLTSRWAALR